MVIKDDETKPINDRWTIYFDSSKLCLKVVSRQHWSLHMVDNTQLLYGCNLNAPTTL